MSGAQASVGSIVHVWERDVGPFAAVVTKISEDGKDEGRVDLYIFPARGRGDIDLLKAEMFDIPYGEETSPYAVRWAWTHAPSK